MPIKVNVEGVGEINFEDGTPDAVIDSTVQSIIAENNGNAANAMTSPPQGAGLPAVAPPASTAPDPTKDNPDMLDNLGRAVTKGAANLVSAPAELAVLGAKGVNSLLNLNHIGDPGAIKPSEQLRAGLGHLGLPSADPVKEGRPTGERFLDNAAEAVTGSGLGLGLGLGIASKLPSARAVLMERFGPILVGEMGAATAGAGARTLAEGDNGQNQGAGAIAEIAANLLVGTTAQKYRQASDLVGDASKLLGGKFSDKTVRESSRLAKEAVTAGGGDKQKVIDALDVPNDPGQGLLTSGQKSNDAGLLGLEKRALSNSSFADRFNKIGADLNSFVRGSIRSALGTDKAPDEAVDFYRTRADRVSDLAEKAYQGALTQLHGAIDSATPRQPGQISTDFREKFREIFDITKADEKKLWDLAGATSDTSALDGVLHKVMEQATVSDKVRSATSMPSKETQQVMLRLSEAKSLPTIEVQSARSDILSEIRLANFEGNESLARRLNVLSDALLDVMEKKTKGLDQDQLENARKFTREMSIRFKDNSEIASLLHKSKQGLPAVPDNQTLDRLIKKGEGGATNALAIKAIFGGVPQQAKEFVTAKFFERAVTNQGDGFNPSRAREFLEDYGPTLEVTGQRGDFEKIIKQAEGAQNIMSGNNVLLNDEKRSATAKVFGFDGVHGYEDVVRGIQKHVLGKNNPTLALQDVIRKANGNQDAIDGVKSAVAEATIRDVFGKTGEALATDAPQKFASIADSLVKSGLYTQGEADNVRRIVNIGMAQRRTENATALERGVATPQNSKTKRLLALVVGFASSRIGQELATFGAAGSSTGAGLRGAAKGSRIGERMVLNMGAADAHMILSEAIFSPPLMRALLSTKDNLSKPAAAVLRDFLGRTAASGSLIQAINRVDEKDD